MARSKGVTISVKTPINWEIMTARSRQRLRQIVGRDTRIIHAYLGIIEQHEDILLTGRNNDRISETELNKITLTALQVKSGASQRLSVPHDFKQRFPRTSQNEFTECRKTAVALYESYLKLRRKRSRNVSRPNMNGKSKRIPRWIFPESFKLVQAQSTLSRWWLDLRDSLDSVPEGRTVHDRLLIPLKVSPYHENQMHRGEVKALQLFKDRFGKWWATLAVRMEIPDVDEAELPPAVLGIDLGIKKAACTVLVTPTKVRESRFFCQKEKASKISRLDSQMEHLQSELDTRKNDGISYDKVALRLRRLKHKRENVSKEYDRVLVRQILDYISELSKKYTLYVSLGRLKGIRLSATKRTKKSKSFRGMIHRWSFARISNMLKHGLSQMSWKVEGKNSRFKVVSEAWTSITCWKCGRKGIRPKQNLFICPTCGNKCNADKNGAINIAARLIMLTDSLHSVGGLGKWVDAITMAKHSQPKARGKKSQGKSLLSRAGSSSEPRESAAVHHTQMRLLSFSDEAEMDDNDPAAVTTVEKLSVAGSDAPASKQRKETRSVGGISSQ